MRDIIESIGLTVSEVVGASVVFGALGLAILIFRQYGDAIISLFVGS